MLSLASRVGTYCAQDTAQPHTQDSDSTLTIQRLFEFDLSQRAYMWELTFMQHNQRIRLQ